MLGEYKIILQLVGVLSNGKAAKQLTDRAIDLMQDVQNLRKAIYEYLSSDLVDFDLHCTSIFSYKLKVEACEKGSLKQQKLKNIAINYLFVTLNYLYEPWLSCIARYRYGTLIVLANYLIETRGSAEEVITFPTWLHEHREIEKLLGRRLLD